MQGWQRGLRGPLEFLFAVVSKHLIPALKAEANLGLAEKWMQEILGL